jgi:competence protein ComEC
MLIARPYNLLDVSFQLSFLAVLGLIFLSNPIAERLARLPRWLAVPLAVSVSCHIALWPLMAWYFQQCSLITTAANLVIVPAAELLLPLGLIQCTLSLVCETLGAPFAAADLALIHFLLKSAAFFQGVPHAFFPLSQPSLPCMVLYYTALFLPHTFVAAMPSFPLRKVPLFLWGAFLIAFAANVIPSAPGHLRAVFFDVGEAEAAFFRLPGGGTLMVDGGGRQGAPDGVRSDLVQYLVRERVGRIDLLVLSHPHLDHVGGMPAIVSAMSTGTFVDGGMEVSQSACLKTMAALKKRGVPVFVPRRGDLWSFPGGEVRVLRSHADYPSGSIQEPNDASIVLKIIYETVSFLMMGDLEKEQERALVESGEDLSCTVLKCAHQGSATSTTEELLEAARPRYAVISVGRNAFGHPSPRVLERLERRGVTCLRTDERGTVQFDVRNGAIAVSVLR